MRTSENHRYVPAVVLAAALAACSGGPSPSPSAHAKVPSGPPASSTATSASPPASAAAASAPPPASAAAAEKPPAPPYDLESDRDARVKLAREDLGASTKAVRVSPIFIVAGPSAAVTASATPFIEAVIGAYTNGRFSKPPSQAISIYIFPESGPYNGFCRKHYGGKDCISRFGFYEPNDRKIIMNGGADGTLSHELVHPFVETDFPEAPTWINEGIASLFEQPVLTRQGEIHGAKNWRFPRLRSAMNSAKEDPSIRLETLFTISDEAFRGDSEDLHYAMARYFCQWMDEKGKLWPFYRAWRDNVKEDPRGEKAFIEVVGKTPKDASADWRRWLHAL
jgi:hypothetical protein